MSKRKTFPKKPSASRPHGHPAAARPRGAGLRDSKSHGGRPNHLSSRHPRGQGDGDAYWLYGSHPVTAALGNARRHLLRLLYTAEAATTVESLTKGMSDRATGLPAPERVDRDTLTHLLPEGAVHQGLAALVRPLPAAALDEVCATLPPDEGTVLLLDQVTDPHNVGAILRSAAAFGAAAVVLTERNAAPESGALAKAASGALEHMPLVRVTNLARALDDLKQAGFWCVGLAAEAGETLAAIPLSGRVALALGSEGAGLRRLTRERCDFLARLPTGGPIADLNVSNAAAVALYERARSQLQSRSGARG
ncbi:23S rRNA (guanosine(2251)-2'-O)-methyltransferase RlmB [Rhodospirillaceae bacterium SYSU D60014]|uniref:23S rRNA (guanosine(2251)-2'-O)-methyltransferase RlmB n=1 Tax=Virgifigura deserti TaxID=2268457 RepID=UPI000E676033